LELFLYNLSRIQINEVRQQLLKLEEKAEADEDAPLFEESGIGHNRYHLSCSDAESYACFEKTVDSMEIRGDNQDEKLSLKLCNRMKNYVTTECVSAGAVVEQMTMVQLQQQKTTYNKTHLGILYSN